VGGRGGGGTNPMGSIQSATNLSAKK